MVMLPEACLVPPVSVYGGMLALAWLAGWWLARLRSRRLSIPVWHIDWLLPLLLVSAGLGSRLGGLLSQLAPDAVANDRVLFGGLVAGLAVAIAYGLTARIPLGRLADTFPVALATGIALLRVGCFFAGCCWGDLCAAPGRLEAVVDDPVWRRQVQTFPALCRDDYPLAVRYPEASPAFYQHLTAGLLPRGADGSLPVHPVQLYEAVAVLALGGLLVLIDRRLRRWGESFLVFALGYCAIRFVCEWFRADTRPWAGDLTPAQFICLIAAGLLALTWAARIGLSRRGHTELWRR
ncbi:MAG: prolipoprotein diacylglyceryl transferase [Pirellulaceae bacterium]|jgi:phosphatidylglycerol:prolipoprotein diacylglycerol transferase|nr:prolipoprotein diacylglyceryl transferase [Pirellulaceae bacterium]MCU0982391.1 prolipoprotein diacylglyceryl transferase [Pirellulaceae bacterium]